MTKAWVKDPHSGGMKIPERIKNTMKNRIVRYAETHYAGKYTRIDVRFKGHFCYIDAYIEPFLPDDFDALKFGETKEKRIERLRNIPIHLCRLRYKGDEEQIRRPSRQKPMGSAASANAGGSCNAGRLRERPTLQ